MGIDQTGEHAGTTYWDRLVAALQTAREAAGNPSFGEIARRIAAAREANGVSTDASKVARSTVYDCFRIGRRRLNLELYREVAHAVGASDSEVDRWLRDSRDPELVEPAAEPAKPALPAADDDDSGAEDGAPTPDQGYGPWSRQVLTLLVTCLMINLLGRELVDLLHLPVYLDMVGTAVAAITLGPWRGVLVGGATNVVGIVGSGLISLPFAAVNIVGALAWGYGVRRFGAGVTLPRFFGLNVACALACSAVAVPILVLVYGGSVGQGQDTVTASFEELTSVDLLAISLSNVLTSVGDKLISGFLALVLVASLPLMFRRGSRLVVADPDL